MSTPTALPFTTAVGCPPDAEPVPTPGPAPTPSAVTITADELAAETSITEARAARLLPVAVAIVSEYAPLAPVAILNEAVIRLVGYLGSVDYGTIRSESLGPMAVDYVTNHSAAFRNSGAAMLLTRWRRRRAGVI